MMKREKIRNYIRATGAKTRRGLDRKATGQKNEKGEKG